LTAHACCHFYDPRVRGFRECVVVTMLMALAACGSSGAKSNASATSPTTAGNSTTPAARSTTAAGGSGTTAARGSVPNTCPTAAVVNAALGTNVGAPTVTPQPYGTSCTYSGGGAIPIRVAFQKDTASTFAAGEAAVPTATKVSGLGDAAYNAGGFLAVLKGTTALRITAPLSTSAQVAALAHKILG
jgi:hypothetical protein